MKGQGADRLNKDPLPILIPVLCPAHLHGGPGGFEHSTARVPKTTGENKMYFFQKKKRMTLTFWPGREWGNSF
ncbi:hypothetical protein DPEC_G00148150 [Dallia pectoralis]|uniref:Uncharacterized protein n=1 Tax=Dallia pectoralis TaxID=75939 RepID=A0ACC2GIG9_DALPE|nr:hypothetical protein DPEC_G00148150 [Dallia pectoralis]